MSNEDLPLSALDSFADKALAVGAYARPLHANLTAAYSLALDHAKKSNAKIEQTKVGAFLASIDSLLDEYGGQTKVSPASIVTYKWRAKRLLQDFIKYNNGDFMGWKTELAKKKGATAAKSAKSKQPAKTVPPPPVDAPTKAPEAQAGHSAHAIKLPGGKTGQLILPEQLTKKEIAVAWKQLEAYRTLLETIAGVDDEDPVSNDADQVA
jgi:hypothetical protein